MGYRDRFADGPYKDHLVAFVEYKRGKGEKCGRNLLVACARISRSLACEADGSGLDEAAVRKALEADEGESETSREHRVSIMRQFCSFMCSLGTPCWKVPPRYYTAPKSMFRPHILSDEDVRSLLRAADSPVPSRGSGRRDRTAPVIARLLLSSGLRISEALALEVDDFSAVDGTLRVTNSKNGVSRLVPLDPTMASRLSSFIDSFGADSGPVFPSPCSAGPYSYEGARHMFQSLYRRSGVRTDDGRLPRIHDLRHTFCVRSLDKMLGMGMDVYEAVPVLAAYVGHVNYANTERYLHLTRAGHASFVESESALGRLIPKVVV